MEISQNTYMIQQSEMNQFNNLFNSLSLNVQNERCAQYYAPPPYTHAHNLKNV